MPPSIASMNSEMTPPGPVLTRVAAGEVIEVLAVANEAWDWTAGLWGIELELEGTTTAAGTVGRGVEEGAAGGVLGVGLGLGLGVGGGATGGTTYGMALIKISCII